MRTKALLGLAVLTASAATCVAADNVYSLNIVGYVNKSVTANTWYLLENPLTVTGNKITDVLKLDWSVGSPWDGTQLYTYTPAGGVKLASTLYAEAGWYPDDVVLTPGAGFYLLPKATGTLTFVGEVVLTNTASLVPGFNMVGSAYPGNMTLADLKLAGNENDIVFRLTPTGYAQPITWYNGLGWYDAGNPTDESGKGPALNVAEAVWYLNKSQSAITWKQEFTVGP